MPTIRTTGKRHALGYRIATRRVSGWNSLAVEDADVLALFPPGIDAGRMVGILEKMAERIRREIEPNEGARPLSLEITWPR